MSDFYPIDSLFTRYGRDLDENQGMRVDKLESPDLDFGCEASLIIVNSDDGVVTESDGAPKQDDRRY